MQNSIFFISDGVGKTLYNNFENLIKKVLREEPLFFIETVTEDKSNSISNKFISSHKTIRTENDNNFIKKQNVEYLYWNAKQIIQSLGIICQQNRKTPLYAFTKKQSPSYCLNFHTLTFYLTNICSFLRIKIERLQKTISYQHLNFTVFYPVYEFYIRIYQIMKKLNHWIYILSFRHAVFLCLF